MKLMEMDMKAMVTRNEEMHKQLQALRSDYEEKQKAIDNFVQENERLLLTNKQLIEKQQKANALSKADNQKSSTSTQSNGALMKEVTALTQKNGELTN